MPGQVPLSLGAQPCYRQSGASEQPCPMLDPKRRRWHASARKRAKVTRYTLARRPASALAEIVVDSQ